MHRQAQTQTQHRQNTKTETGRGTNTDTHTPDVRQLINNFVLKGAHAAACGCADGWRGAVTSGERGG